MAEIVVRPGEIGRFWARTCVNPLRITNGIPCLEWTAARNRLGYGLCKASGVMQRAHRVAWTLGMGPIPRGLNVLHECDNPPCVERRHLFLGTNADNVADRDAKGRTARGDRGGLHVHPERAARGDHHGSRTCPERIARGERNGNARLTEDAVRAMRRDHETGVVSCVTLGKRYGVSGVMASNVIRGKSWRHLLAPSVAEKAEVPA